MGYEIVMTQLAKEQLDAFLRYHLSELQDYQNIFKKTFKEQQ